MVQSNRQLYFRTITMNTTGVICLLVLIFCLTFEFTSGVSRTFLPTLNFKFFWFEKHKCFFFKAYLQFFSCFAPKVCTFCKHNFLFACLHLRFSSKSQMICLFSSHLSVWVWAVPEVSVTQEGSVSAAGAMVMALIVISDRFR